MTKATARPAPKLSTAVAGDVDIKPKKLLPRIDQLSLDPVVPNRNSVHGCRP